jgi:hypothetical protein
MRRFLYRAMQVLLVLVLGFILWAGWYASQRGFGRKWRQFVTAEFRKRGVELTMRRLTLDPLQGIVAREVRVMDPNDRSRLLAFVDRVVLEVNYGNLLHGEPFLNAIGLSDASIALPLDPSDKKSPRVEIARLNALVVLPPHQIYVSHLDADLYGLHVFATGRLINPDRLKPAQPEPDRDSGELHRLVLQVITELKKLEFGRINPRIDITFSGDAAEPEKIFAQATLWAESVERSGYRLRNLYAAASWREGVVVLHRCTAADAKGGFDGSARFVPGTGTGSFQLRSELDLQALGHALRASGKVEEFVFYDSPTVEVAGELNGGEKPGFLATGRLDLKRFGYKSVLFDGLNAAFSWDGHRWYVRDLSLAQRNERLTASALHVPGDFRASIASTLNPRALLPLVSGKAAEVLGEWKFQQAPRVSMEVSGPAPNPDECRITGSIELGKSALRDVPLNRANARFLFENKTVTYEGFRIERDEGVGTGTFAYDFGKHEVRLENIKSTLLPVDVAKWIDRRLVHDVAPYKFKTPPRLTVNGVVQTNGGKETRLEIGVNAPSGMDYVFMKKNLSFPSISGKLIFTEGRLRLADVAGILYGGQMRGEADISLRKGAPGYTAHIEADGVDFPSVTKLYFNYGASQGALSGFFDFRGKGDPRSLQGKGSVEVREGDVFSIPVLGPFSGILNSLVPGMGYNVARAARCTFDLREGVITTNDFLVQGRGFDMLGGGKLHYLDDRMDFSIRINAQGLPGVLLFPVSKLLEYTAESSLSKPVWKPKRLPAL